MHILGLASYELDHFNVPVCVCTGMTACVFAYFMTPCSFFTVCSDEGY